MRILVCPPDYFDVNYVINPWMEGQQGRVDRCRAKAQWETLVEHYARAAQVEIVAAAPDCPDMCFTANAGLVAEDLAVPARFRMPERSREEAPFKEYFANADFAVHPLQEEASFEGEGDALFAPGESVLWAGYGVRSALETHPALGERFGVEVLSLRLVDPRFYHLDTCFAPMPDGRVLYFPPAFDERSRRLIEERVPKDARIEVSEADACGFSCNVMRVDDRVFMNQASEELQRSLANWGYETVICPVDEFMRAGGGVKCLSLILDQPEFKRLAAPCSAIASADFELQGHLLDAGLLNRTLDLITQSGGSFRVDRIDLAERNDQPSRAVIRIISPTQGELETILHRLENEQSR
ncbi:MAG: arginine deiminase-related protein [Myxococcota bacterium]